MVTRHFANRSHHTVSRKMRRTGLGFTCSVISIAIEGLGESVSGERGSTKLNTAAWRPFVLDWLRGDGSRRQPGAVS
jgi:hypothetical protein